MLASWHRMTNIGQQQYVEQIVCYSCNVEQIYVYLLKAKLLFSEAPEELVVGMNSHDFLKRASSCWTARPSGPTTKKGSRGTQQYLLSWATAVKSSATYIVSYLYSSTLWHGAVRLDRQRRFESQVFIGSRQSRLLVHVEHPSVTLDVQHVNGSEPLVLLGCVCIKGHMYFETCVLRTACAYYSCTPIPIRCIKSGHGSWGETMTRPPEVNAICDNAE